MQALTLAAASCTHAGRRRSNQDAVVVRRLANGGELIAVADGMGGHSAGEVASAMALEALIAQLEAGTPLASAVAAANATVHQGARTREEWQGMGTTLVVMLRSGDGYQIANVGDSRAYVIDDATIRQVTRDHSFVAEAIRSGSISEAEAVRSPWRNALTRALGTDPSVEVDVFGPFATTSAHAVLLCSDGLYKAVVPELIREYVLSTADLGTAVEALAALAYRRGSDDNITVAAVEFESLTRRDTNLTLPLPIRLQGGDGDSRPTAAGADAAPHAASAPPASTGSATRRAPAAPSRRGWWGLLLGAVLLLAVVWIAWSLGW